MSHSSINVSWELPAKNGDTVTEYVVNVTTLRSFDAPFSGLGYGSEASSIAGTSSLSSSTPSPSEAKTTMAPSSSSSITITTTGGPGTAGKKGRSGIDISSEERVEVQMRQIKVKLLFTV
jgi:hypothetical protein